MMDTLAYPLLMAAFALLLIAAIGLLTKISGLEKENSRLRDLIRDFKRRPF